MQPVYPLTAGLTNNMIMKTMKQAIEYLDLRKEFLPKKVSNDSVYTKRYSDEEFF